MSAFAALSAFRPSSVRYNLFLRKLFISVSFRISPDFSSRFAEAAIDGALTLDDYTAEIICDNVHSHPAAQNLAYRAKGNRGIILITDCIRPSGLPDGTYPFTDTVDVTVSENGTNLRLPGGNLAGSALTMDRALKNFSENTGAPLEELWRCSSLNAAIKIGVSAETGSIEKGKLADLVLMTDAFEVTHTIIEGSVVFER